MTAVEQKLALNLRRFFRIGLGFKDKFETTSDNCDYFEQSASDLIRDGLASNAPFAVSRFGHSELRALLTYLHIQEDTSEFRKLLSFIKGDKVEPWWNKNTLKIITHNAGLFPKDIQVIENFCELILRDMKEIDVLGSWLGGEMWIKDMMPDTKFMRFHDFYHFLHRDPWTTALKDKKILVVHPFSKSIQSQYKIKDKIFSGAHTLPDFELITYKAVQSIAGNKPEGFNTWFEALDAMKTDFSKIDFDIAILGCGAYGMPLAASIKRDLRKKAVHLGGNTQILFGIKGSRWESDPNFSHIFNSYWIKPLPEETPAGHVTIDSNCYW
ncbi:hypothetical protein [Chryseolinea sp. H1M3-3]|uniref:hypothetical protein n=1 Tax=Chryseolinea sp. H1M3-3 TaxID=3034144 RepID=UPI0023EB78D7|nr:hypothetical protein [Chryseolinea sp. H1M3-3]